jgi:hypothetical protein
MLSSQAADRLAGMTLIASVEMRFSLPEPGGEDHVSTRVHEMDFCRSSAFTEGLEFKPSQFTAANVQWCEISRPSEGFALLRTLTHRRRLEKSGGAPARRE